MARLRVAITGNAGSGKSTVAEMLRKRGIVVIDADTLAHGVMAKPEVVEALKKAFGAEYIRADGTVDRKKLGDLVFANPARMQKLLGIMKPKVAFALGKALSEAKGDIVAVEGALVYEYGLENMFEFVVVVVSEPEAMVRRIMASHGYDEAKARNVLASQNPQEEKASRAHFVMQNTGSLAQLEQKVEELLAELTEER